MSGFNSKQHVSCLVAYVVGGAYGPIYQHEIERLTHKNGEAWVATRLKAIWNAALHLKNGDRDKAQELYQKNSISYHKGDLTPKGPFRRAVSVFLEANRPSTLRRWAALLRYYTGVVLSDPTPQQVKSAKASITSDGPKVPQSIKDEFRSVVRGFLKKYPGPRPGVEWKDSASWESQFAQSLKGSSAYYSPVPCPRELKKEYYGSFMHSMLTTWCIPECIEHRIKCESIASKRWIRSHDKESDPVGKVFFINEGGAKLRCVAQPSAWLQLAFRPLHSILSQLQEKLHESCVTDQVRGVQLALQELKEGNDIFSVDLSSATDRLPRELQVILLEELGLPDYAEALDYVSTRPWSFPDGSMVSYTVGQPMGLFGSFPLLNNTNCMIGRMACIRCDCHGRTDHYFVVVGDDIVFFNRRVAAEYRKIMAELGVEVSPLKTFEGKVGQFAGFVMLPNKSGYTAFRPYKHPAGKNITNPIHFLHSLGSSLKSLNKRWEKIFNLYQVTASQRLLDLGPIPAYGLEENEPLLEGVDNRWAYSLMNKACWLEPDAVKEQIDHGWVPEDQSSVQPGETVLPLFHEQRVDRLMGYEINNDLNRQREQEVFRVQTNLLSDPLYRRELERDPDLTYGKYKYLFVDGHGRVTGKKRNRPRSARER